MSLNITPLRIEDAESNHNNSTNTYPERFILNDNWSKTNILDIIPSKYERKSKSLYLKYLTYLIIVIIILIFFGTFQLINQKFNTYLEIINFIFIVIFLILNVSWLYYKLQHVIIGSYKIFMDLNIIHSNGKYYSGLEIPDSFINNNCYPDITIQLPVYKESLENTIKPTILSAIIESKRYTLETGKICNIIVCDDGINLISPEEKEERLIFYRSNNIGISARPHPSKHPRIGRFKKAGNLNFSMNYSDLNKENTNIFSLSKSSSSSSSDKNSLSDISPLSDDSSLSNESSLSDKSSLLDKNSKLNNFFKKMLNLNAYFEGNLTYGSYIFLIDSDTRFPNFPSNQNGCLKRIIKDFLFDGSKNILYIQCFTGPYLSTKSLPEKAVYHFTSHIYNGILIATAMNSMAPLVGHNACLNYKLLNEIANVDENTGLRYYWDENRISEDFDCMMRGCEKGYIGRYMSCAGIFLEGISFNYMTEYFKVSKFACGAAELTFNSVSKWFVKDGGFFSSDIIGFIMCKEIEWYNKLSILSYILNFIAIAQSHISMFYNLIFFEELFSVLPYMLLPINLMWEGMVIWGLVNTINNIIFSQRMQFETWLILKQQLREFFFTSSLYGSLSVRFSIMYLTHLFNLPISFGATQKDNEKVTLLDWIKSTKYECVIYTFYLICIIIRLWFFPIRSRIHTFYFGCLPLFTNIFWYWFGPLVFDILPKNIDKTSTVSYNNEIQMFYDKYLTQIPNSNLFNDKYNI